MESINWRNEVLRTRHTVTISTKGSSVASRPWTFEDWDAHEFLSLILITLIWFKLSQSDGVLVDVAWLLVPLLKLAESEDCRFGICGYDAMEPAL